MRSIACVFLASILLTWNVSAATIAYTEYTFTKKSALVIQGEVIECRTNGSYCVRVDRVLKGQYTEKFIDLPYRYFYTRLTPEWNDLPLSKSSKAVLFLQYAINGEHDALYKMLEARCLNAGTPQNHMRIPYEEGYEIILGEKGAQVRGTQEELNLLSDTISLINTFSKDKTANNLEALFMGDSVMRGAALDALYENRELFDINRNVFGPHIIRCLDDPDLSVRNRATSIIVRCDYREATGALLSRTNSPNAYFRKSIFSALKMLEQRNPKKTPENGP